MKTTSIIAFILAIIGAINWMIIGFFGFNLVGWAFSFMPIIADIIYVLVGFSGLWLIFFIFFYRPFRHVA